MTEDKGENGLLQRLATEGQQSHSPHAGSIGHDPAREPRQKQEVPGLKLKVVKFIA